MTFNLDLAVRVLANIELAQHSEGGGPGWDQEAWGRITGVPQVQDGHVLFDKKGRPKGVGTCNTSMCFAGWALVESGIPMEYTEVDHSPYVYEARTTKDGHNVQDAATQVLGMYDGVDPHWDYEDGLPELFKTGNTLDDLYDEVARMADEGTYTVSRQVARLLASDAVTHLAYARLVPKVKRG